MSSTSCNRSTAHSRIRRITRPGIARRMPRASRVSRPAPGGAPRPGRALLPRRSGSVDRVPAPGYGAVSGRAISPSRITSRRSGRGRAPMAGFEVEHWWDEPHFKRSNTRAERARFVLLKLMQLDPRRLEALLWEVCGLRDYAEAAQSITDDQWREILTGMGATPLDAADVLIRIG